MALLQDAFVYLLAAVVAVPIASRLGLGSVLGYLLAGLIIGPILGIVGREAVDVQHFAEFGVVMMLFLVGLELQPAVLWRMRAQLLGLGGLQVLLTTGLLAGMIIAIGYEWQVGLVVGMTLSLSSTAIVLQSLDERGLMTSPGGRSCFAVLLSQDIAVIPMLALLPLLAIGAIHGPGGEDHTTPAGLLDGLPVIVQMLAILAVIGTIILAGRFAIRPVFRFIADARLREVFTAAALLLVIGIALLMQLVGLSAALGTFLAGVVLSGSEYRRELESDIDPFKGLLLGLFFIAVGAGIDVGLLMSEPLAILGLALAIMLAKFAVLFALGQAFDLPLCERWLFALSLAQAGEFAFVLFSVALGAGALPGDLAERLTLVVTLTMLLTPCLFIAYQRFVVPRLQPASEGREPDAIEDSGTVVIAGMGRFGQIVARLLLANGYPVVILDHDPDIITGLNRVGLKTYYGDATRPDLLASAGLKDATLFVAALDDRECQLALVAHVAKCFPHVRILARARDRHHLYELEAAGAHSVEREVFEGSLALGREALVALGCHPFTAEQRARAFRRHDRGTLEALRETWLTAGINQTYVDTMRARLAQIAGVMQGDEASDSVDLNRGWTPPPAGEAAASASSPSAPSRPESALDKAQAPAE